MKFVMNSKEILPFKEKNCLNSKEFLFLLLKLLSMLNSFKFQPSFKKLNFFRKFSLNEKIFMFFPSF